MHSCVISIFSYCVTLLSICVNVLYIMISFFYEANKDYYYFYYTQEENFNSRNDDLFCFLNLGGGGGLGHAPDLWCRLPENNLSAKYMNTVMILISFPKCVYSYC